MNRPVSDLPSVDVLGAWALTYWLDAPQVTITTNRGDEHHVFTAANAAQRTGCPYLFEFGYVLALYQAEQGNLDLQRSIRQNATV